MTCLNSQIELGLKPRCLSSQSGDLGGWQLSPSLTAGMCLFAGVPFTHGAEWTAVCDRWVNEGWAWVCPFFKTMGSSVKNSVNVIL